MLADYHFVRAAATRIGEAADGTTRSVTEGPEPSAPKLIEQWVRAAARSVDGFRHGNLRWRSKALVAAAEQAAAAQVDLLCVLDVDLPGYTARRGFLAQAFAIDAEHPPDSGRLQTLRSRSATLLRSTAAAFVLVLRSRGPVVVPASAVVAATGRPDRLHKRKVGHFFEEFFSGFLGDPKMAQVAGEESATLETLMARRKARAGLALHVESVSTPRQESLFRH